MCKHNLRARRFIIANARSARSCASGARRCNSHRARVAQKFERTIRSTPGSSCRRTYCDSVAISLCKRPNISASSSACPALISFALGISSAAFSYKRPCARRDKGRWCVASIGRLRCAQPRLRFRLLLRFLQRLASLGNANDIAQTQAPTQTQTRRPRHAWRTQNETLLMQGLATLGSRNVRPASHLAAAADGETTRS